MSDAMLQTWVTVQTWLDAAKHAVVREEEGQGLVEYALILGLVAVLAITILLTMGSQVNNIFSNISVKLAQLTCLLTVISPLVSVLLLLMLRLATDKGVL